MTFNDDFLLWQKKFFAETNINAKDFKNKTLFSSIDTKEINLPDFAGVFVGCTIWRFLAHRNF